MRYLLAIICAASVILIQGLPCLGYLTKSTAKIDVPAAPGVHEEFTNYAIDKLDLDYEIRKNLNKNLTRRQPWGTFMTNATWAQNGLIISG